MRFYSTRRQSPDADWQTVLMQGLPADNGLYMPETIGKMPDDFWTALPHLTFPELAFAVAQCLLQDSLPTDDLRLLVNKAINFDAPIRDVYDGVACLELFHGPSLAFKDFGARFMAQMMSYFVRKNANGQAKKTHILVATSGDTGGAVAQGFFNAEGVEVIILYPSQKISRIQEQQLTALGGNVRAIEIKGTFDDCQRMVKQAFLDADLTAQINLSSANSINLARLIPQAFYYVRAYQQVMQRGKEVVFCVPSGNFGNMCAGLLAKRIGLPVQKFIAATNANDTFTQYWQSGLFTPRPSVHTLSNAMDVGNPSNLVRIQDLYDNNIDHIRQDITAYSFSDEQTTAAIKHLYQNYNYLVCPHTAVAYLGLQTYLEQNPEKRAQTQGIFLGTAHPAKFYDIVEPTLNISVPIPDSLEKLLEKPKVATLMEPDYSQLRHYLLA
jgi:threonine synthase